MALEIEYVRIAILNANDQVLTFMDNTLPGAMRYFDETLTKMLDGNAYTFDFKTYTDHDDSLYLEPGNAISFDYKGKSYFCKIVSTEKEEYFITVKTYGTTFELLNDTVNKFEGTGLTLEEYVRSIWGAPFVEQGTSIFTINVNEAGSVIKTASFDSVDTTLKRLYLIAELFETELEINVVRNSKWTIDSVELNFYLKHDDSHNGMGKDRRGEILRYGKEITSIRRTSDISDLCTAVRPYGKDGLNLTNWTPIIELNQQSTYLDSDGNVLYQFVGNDIRAPQSRDRFPNLLDGLTTENYIIKVLEISDCETKAELFDAALAELKANCLPKLSYDISGYIDADIGDTFTIVDQEFNPPLYLEARVVEQEIHFTAPETNKTTFDNFTEVSSEIDPSIKELANALYEKLYLYQASIRARGGVIFKMDDQEAVLEPKVLSKDKDITSQFTYKWYKDDVYIKDGSTLTIHGSDIPTSTNQTIFRFDAVKNGNVECSAEITCARLYDGLQAFLHIAYATSADGHENFSITDSVDKSYLGQYTDFISFPSEDPDDYRWTLIKGPPGEPLVTLSISSTKGTTFKNNSVSTKLKVTVKVGNTSITDALHLSNYFGPAAYLQWKELKNNQSTPVTISPIDSRLDDSGFIFNISPQDVDTKSVFTCDLYY